MKSSNEKILSINSSYSGKTNVQSSAPIRVKLKTKNQLDLLLNKANKKSFGHKVKPDDIISFCLNLIDDKEIKIIQEKTVCNKDRFEMLFKKLSTKNKDVSRDDLLGMLIDGKLAL